MTKSLVGDFGRGAVGVGIGFGLYLLLTQLGFGGGRAKQKRGEGMVAPRHRDTTPLHFLLSSRGFEPRTADWTTPPDARTYTLADVIERVLGGGRHDVVLKVTGDVIERDYSAARGDLATAGIEVLEAHAPAVSGAHASRAHTLISWGSHG